MKCCWTVLICIFLSASLYSQSRQACDRASDSLELIRFYNTFNGNSWTNRTNWLVPGRPISSWFGIHLSASGCVDSIKLEKNNLRGNLYDLNFQGLRKLNLNNNLIANGIPNFTFITDLIFLDLSHNQLKDQIPNFSSLPKLIHLNLGFNALTGSIPDFTKMLSLKILDFSNNQLSGEIPDFTRLPALIELLVPFNELTGPIPDFSKLPNLEVIIVHGNKLNGNIPNFSKIPKLTHILAAYNQLSGPVPDFTNIPNMYQLMLSDNRLTGTIPDFSNLPVLGILYLSHNKLTDSIPDFTKTPNLSIINFSYNNLSGKVPDFNRLNHLIWLVLSGNQLRGAIPNYSNRFPNLLDIRLDNNYLSGPIPDYSHFDFFSIWNNHFTFSDIITSNNLSNFQFYHAPQRLFYKDTVIHIKKNSPVTIDLVIDPGLTDNYFDWYKNKFAWAPPPGNDINSNKLKFLNPQVSDAGRYHTGIYNNQAADLYLLSHTISLRVCDELKDSLELIKLYNATDGSNWKNNTNWLQAGKRINTWYGVSSDSYGCVNKIDLSNNNLKGVLPVLSMNTLDTLILNNNQIGSVIPELEIPFIRWLELSNNELIGDFPNNLKNWYDLNGLNLSINGITGTVPPDLGDLCELNMLRLNKNKISGELPEQLTMLVNLKKGQVDFSENQIDSLKNKLIWFCPFGDSILQTNPSYDRFLGICNVQCSGNEFKDLKKFPWIIDIVNDMDCDRQNCVLTLAQAGFVKVRGVSTFYTLSRCYSFLGPPPVFTDIVRFYDCGGHLLETVTHNVDTFYAQFNAITKEDFISLRYDMMWQCGQALNMGTGTSDPDRTYNNKNDALMNLICSPNPAQLLLRCSVKNDMNLSTIQVFDILGKSCKIQLEKQNDHLYIDVTALQPGIYFISIEGRIGKYSGKVVVE
jgi:Leucine-rich repeat (LRR) protein